MIPLLLACAEPAPPAAPLPCFSEIDAAGIGVPDYEALGIALPAHCSGTDLQEIEGIERVVFLGDSVTEGTPPTDSDEFYRALVADGLVERFGAGLEVSVCSEWGARTDDLLQDGDPSQILECFPEGETRPTLVIMTVGGNDVTAFGDELDAGATDEEVLVMVDEALQLLRDAIVWLDDPVLFPGGVDVVMGNVYEFTDATGDLGSCPTAEVFGFTGVYPQMLDGYTYINAAYAQMAADLGVDLVFMYEQFCGHGFHNDDPESLCYRGEGAERWFDNTCIHPSPEGHAELARMFLEVVDE